MAEYIEREELLRELRLWHMHRNDEMPDYFHYTGIKAWLEALPAADVQPVKHGKWIPVTNGRGGNECNQCHAYAPSYQNGSEYKTKYCPNCGAKMDGEDNG